MTLPDFLIVGAPKSGSTALHAALDRAMPACTAGPSPSSGPTIRYRVAGNSSRSASAQAWATTSASLWPRRARSLAKVTPPTTSGRSGSVTSWWTSKP